MTTTVGTLQFTVTNQLIGRHLEAQAQATETVMGGKSPQSSWNPQVFTSFTPTTWELGYAAYGQNSLLGAFRSS